MSGLCRQDVGMSACVVDLEMRLAWRYASGAAMERFLSGLREGRIEALRCDGCRRVYLPPRPFCGPCRRRMDSWVDVRDEGLLQAWTIMHAPVLDSRTGRPRPLPYAMGLVLLDGADTTINHYLAGTDGARLAVGQRLRAVWRDDRQGALDDIACFEVCR